MSRPHVTVDRGILAYSSEYTEQGILHMKKEEGLYSAIEIKIEHMTRKIGR